MTNKRKGFEKNGIKGMSARLIFDSEVTWYGPNEVRSVRCDGGLSIFQYGPGNQLINSLLTGYKTHVSCAKTSLLRDKNAELLSDNLSQDMI